MQNQQPYSAMITKKLRRPLPPEEELTAEQLFKREQQLRADTLVEVRHLRKGAAKAHLAQQNEFEAITKNSDNLRERMSLWGHLAGKSKVTEVTSELDEQFRKVLGSIPMVPKQEVFQKLQTYASHEFQRLTEGYKETVQNQHLALRQQYFKDIAAVKDDPEKLRRLAEKLQSDMLLAQRDAKANFRLGLVQLRNRIEFGGIPGDTLSLEEMSQGAGYDAMREVIDYVNEELDKAEDEVFQTTEDVVRQQCLFNGHAQNYFQDLILAFNKQDEAAKQLALRKLREFPYKDKIVNFEAQLQAISNSKSQEVLLQHINVLMQTMQAQAQQATVAVASDDMLTQSQKRLNEALNQVFSKFDLNVSAIEQSASKDMQPLVEAFNQKLKEKETLIERLLEDKPEDLPSRLEKIYLECAESAFKVAGIQRDKHWRQIETEAKDFADQKIESLKEDSRKALANRVQHRRRKSQYVQLAEGESALTQNLNKLKNDGDTYKSPTSGITYERKGEHLEASIPFEPTREFDWVTNSLFGQIFNPFVWLKQLIITGKNISAEATNANRAGRFATPTEMAQLGEALEGSPVVISCANPKLEQRLVEYYQKHGQEYGIQVLGGFDSSKDMFAEASKASDRERRQAKADTTPSLNNSKRARDSGDNYTKARSKVLKREDASPPAPIDESSLTIKRSP